MGRYYQLERNGRQAEISIYGDIVSWPRLESDVSSHNLSKQLAELDVDELTVRINSYGGEVAEGLAIFNQLKSHDAHVTTVCDGMACSIASVIFMAGDERIMNEASLLMIHNVWSYVSGDANELRKAADDLEAMTKPSREIYLAATDLTEDELTEWMNAEKWIDAQEALERGFATQVRALSDDQRQQTARLAFAKRIASIKQHPGNPIAGDMVEGRPAPQNPAPEQAQEAAPAAEFPGMSLRMAQAYMDLQTQ